MLRFNKKSITTLAGAFLLVWLGLKYLLPLVKPFLLGTALALAAEPVARRLSGKLPRAAASAIGILLALILLGGGLVLLTALLLRELTVLAQALPDLGSAAQDGVNALRTELEDLALRSPAGLQPVLTGAVDRLFSGGGLGDRLMQQIPDAAGAVLGWIPGSALTLGTGILSAFMISARMPKLRALLQRRSQEGFLEKCIPLFCRVKHSLGGWLKAQLRLMLLCFLIVCGGLLVLGVSYAPLWALLVTLVDAVPMLGSGTVLIPWAVVCFLREQTVQGIGLLGVYLVAMLSRSILEPRLVGKQLGLDPLVTLVALYVGYRLWGIPGMLLSPMICVAALEAARPRPAEN